MKGHLSQPSYFIALHSITKEWCIDMTTVTNEEWRVHSSHPLGIQKFCQIAKWQMTCQILAAKLPNWPSFCHSLLHYFFPFLVSCFCYRYSISLGLSSIEPWHFISTTIRLVLHNYLFHNTPRFIRETYKPPVCFQRDIIWDKRHGLCHCSYRHRYSSPLSYMRHYKRRYHFCFMQQTVHLVCSHATKQLPGWATRSWASSNGPCWLKLFTFPSHRSLCLVIKEITVRAFGCLAHLAFWLPNAKSKKFPQF